MKLKIQKRDVLGKKVKNLRKQGLVPLVVYGKSLSNPLHLMCDRIEFVKMYKKVGTSTPITLEWDGIKQMVLIYDMQLDPVSDMLTHIDFIAIQKWQKVSTDVSVVLVGEAPIEKEGEWQVQLLKDTIEIEAVPSNLPKEFQIDISEIKDSNDTIHLGDVKMPEWVELLEDPDQTVVTVVQLWWEEEEEEQLVNAAGDPIEAEELNNETDATDTEK